MKQQEFILYDSGKRPLLRLFHSVVPAGRRAYREHHHTECELSLFCNGAGIYTVGKQTYTFQKGDVFLFGSDETHCITNIFDEEPFDLLNIHFEPRILWDSQGGAALPLLRVFHNRSAEFSNQIHRENPLALEMIPKILEMEKEFQKKEIGYELKIRLYLYDVLLLLLRSYTDIEEKDFVCANEKILGQLSDAITFINLHYTDILTLEEVARKATMSKAYFSTIFKKYNGISPWDYIIIKRIEKAMNLLRHNNFTKLEIAEQCGFQSISNFYKAFQKVTGMSPTSYIKAKNNTDS